MFVTVTHFYTEKDSSDYNLMEKCKQGIEIACDIMLASGWLNLMTAKYLPQYFLQLMKHFLLLKRVI